MAGRLSRSIGGEFPISPDALLPELLESLHPLFSSGREALAAIVNRVGRAGDRWLAPEFTCPVVPETLRACGMNPVPYRWITPWDPDQEDVRRQCRDAAGVIVPFYMGWHPDPSIWNLLERESLCVVEDRCQCVGPPKLSEIRGHYAIGSYRKWLPVPDGAYCMSRRGPAPIPDDREGSRMADLRLAGAVVKHSVCAALDAESGEMPESKDRERMTAEAERIYFRLFLLAENLVSLPSGRRRAIRLSELLIRAADVAAIRERRMSNQRHLARLLVDNPSVSVLNPNTGVAAAREPLLALPVLVKARDSLRQRLMSRGILCDIHWKDGDWSGRGERAAAWAEGVLSLPIDQRYNLMDMDRIAEALRIEVSGVAR